MKKNYTSMLLLLSSMFSFSQAYNGAGADDLWSNTANWSSNTIVAEGAVLNIWNIPATLDIDVAPPTVKFLTNLEARSTDFTVISTNAHTLTIDNGNTITNWSGNTAAYGIKNQTKDDPTTLKIDSKIIFSNTEAGFTVLRNDGHPNNTIEMGENSELVMSGNGNGGTWSDGNLASRNFLFNGVLSGTKIFSIAAGNVVFGATSNNVNFQENISFLANATVTVNTNNTFLNGSWDNRLQANGDNATITFNTPNTLINEVDLSVKTGITFNVVFNANQNGLGLIRFLDAGAGTIKITVDPGVTELKFVGNQFQDWLSGTLQISGFKENVFRFGTTNAGLTATQLSKIVIVDGAHAGKSVGLNADGYLYLDETLLSSANKNELVDFAVYPNPVKDVVKVQTSAKIASLSLYDMLGNLMLQTTAKELNVTSLSAGVYILKALSDKGKQATQKVVIQ